MKTVAIIQARMGSSRLPGKVLMDLGGKPVLEWCIRACNAAQGVDEVVVATTTEGRDNAIFDLCADRGDVFCVRGSETDVLRRFRDVAEATNGDIFLRLTGDCPFLDPEVIAAVVRQRKLANVGYCSNIHPRSYADGLDVECFTRQALLEAEAKATRYIHRDTVTGWMVLNRDRVSRSAVLNSIDNQEHERWVLDTEADYLFCQAIAGIWRWSHGAPSQFDILDILDRHPQIREFNKGHIMNERYFAALEAEPKHVMEQIKSTTHPVRLGELIEQYVELKIEEHERKMGRL